MAERMRLQQIDFLRGLAVLMVVFFHLKSIRYFNVVGWMGVDLFFVLSGYLISGLIFKELKTFGDFRPGLFLIRRGFKIYPAFYVFLALTVIFRLISEQDIPAGPLLFEASFTRNFFGGFWAHTWSLCIEEHFYFLLALALFFIPFKFLDRVNSVNGIIGVLLLLSLLLRLGNYYVQATYGESFFFNDWARRVQTFYCLDALLFGVLISYNLHFNKERFLPFYQKLKPVGLPLALASVIVLPLVMTSSLADCFLKTILYLSFGVILTAFLADDRVFGWLQKYLPAKLLALISYIGLFSYPIYLIHPLIRDYVMKYIPLTDYRLVFLCYLVLSVGAGIFLYTFIEKYFLVLREKHFPNRKRPVVQEELALAS